MATRSGEDPESKPCGPLRTVLTAGTTSPCSLRSSPSAPPKRTLRSRPPRRAECSFCLYSPEQAVAQLRHGDAALGRLDVLPTLDGVEDGLWALGSLAAGGIRTLNRAGALLAAHDKLLTARLLLRAGLPHPRTRLLSPGGPLPELRLPVVVKPRFGSWGTDVVRCADLAALRRHVRELELRPWYRAHGALVQELVPPQGSDLRIVVAGGAVVGAIERVASKGEWRTNVALGAERRPVEPPSFACMLASRPPRPPEAT